MASATIGDNTGNTYTGTADTSIKSTATTSNFGSDTSLDVTKYAVGNHNTGLVKFSGLSNIAGPVTVTAATLYLYGQNNPGLAGYTHTLYRILRNWVEAQVTWNVYSTGNNWTTAGCLSNGNDKSATESAHISQEFWVGYSGFTAAQLIADVQDMINNPSTNYGWTIERTDSQDDSRFILFTSREGADTQRPYLDITYTTGGGGPVSITPTPAGSLVGSGIVPIEGKGLFVPTAIKGT